MTWISIKDELPPLAGYDLCKKYLIYDRCIAFAYFMNGKWRTGDLDYFPGEAHPTHWMPLPELPEVNE